MRTMHDARVGLGVVAESSEDSLGRLEGETGISGRIRANEAVTRLPIRMDDVDADLAVDRKERLLAHDHATANNISTLAPKRKNWR